MILQGFLIGAMLVALYFLFVMIRNRDAFDWKFDKADIWIQFCLLVLLWPLPIIGRIKSGKFNAVELLSLSSNKATYQRTTSKDKQELKQCGAYIRFTPIVFGLCEKSHGEFVFPSSSVERLLLKRLNENPPLKHGEEGKLLTWIQQRDENIQEPTAVSGIWSCFNYLVDDLIKQQVGSVLCTICQKHMSLEQLQKKNTAAYSITLRGYVCPQGHTIVSSEGVRLQRIESR